MKKLVVILITLAFIWTCSSNSTGNDNQNGGTNNFVSNNVKSDTTFFNFKSNSGSSSEPTSWDIAFASIPYVQFIGCQSQAIKEPIIMLGDGVTATRVDAASLDDVTEIPASGFTSDDPEKIPFIGETWLDQSYNVTNEVYAIKTCSDNFAVVQFVHYDYDLTEHQVYNITGYYKYNMDGSNDFSSATTDSFSIPNAYTDKQYFSFLNGAVTANDQSDIVVNEFAIWLGIGDQVKKLDTTDIESVTTVSDDSWQTDKGPEYVTLSWYNYNTSNHVLTPKDYVYIVHTPDDKYAAFKIKNYYDDMGESGVFTIDWKYLQ